MVCSDSIAVVSDIGADEIETVDDSAVEVVVEVVVVLSQPNSTSTGGNVGS